MRTLFFTLIFISLNISCTGQEGKPCFRDVLISRYKSMLPQEVCIPEGYIIDEIFDSTDVNGDRLNEFIFSWRKKNFEDGDTLFISFYMHFKNDKYQFFKTLKNLFPINFKRYDFEYNVEDKTLNEVWNKYNGMNPFVSLDIRNDFIILKILCSVGDGYVFYYQYDISKNNWLLRKVEKWNDNSGELIITEIKNRTQTIDEFSYFDYMY